MIQTHKSLGAAALAGALAMACAAHADPAPPHILSVSGQGEVRAVPDQAQLSAGVVTEGKTAAAALAANSRAMNDVFAAIRKLGVPERSIRTSNFTVSPQYAPYRNNGGDDSAQRIIDYQVSNEVTVILDDVSKVGPALDALVSSGANQANSISFGIRDQKPLLEQARDTRPYSFHSGRWRHATNLNYSNDNGGARRGANANRSWRRNNRRQRVDELGDQVITFSPAPRSDP